MPFEFYCERQDEKYAQETHHGELYYELLCDNQFHARKGHKYVCPYIEGHVFYIDFSNDGRNYQFHATDNVTGTYVCSGNSYADVMDRLDSLFKDSMRKYQFLERVKSCKYRCPIVKIKA